MPAEKRPFEIFVSTKKWARLESCVSPGPKILTSALGGSEVVDPAGTPGYPQSCLLSFIYVYIQSFRSGVGSRSHAGQL